MENQLLVHLAERYRKLGNTTHHSLLLHPGDALALLDELLPLGVTVVACDEWQLVPPYKAEDVVELPGAGFDISRDVAWEQIPSVPSIPLIQKHIRNNLLPETDLVALAFHNDAIDALFNRGIQLI